MDARILKLDKNKLFSIVNDGIANIFILKYL